MTTEELQACFEKHSDEYIKFDRIEKPMHRRPDICAFLMLDLVPPIERKGTMGDMVTAAEHDIFFLDVTVEELAAVATDEMVRDLSRCGVMYSDEFDCLAMFS